jgi:hypothetical protein
MYGINLFTEEEDRTLESQVMQIHERGDDYWNKT